MTFMIYLPNNKLITVACYVALQFITHSFLWHSNINIIYLIAGYGFKIMEFFFYRPSICATFLR